MFTKTTIALAVLVGVTSGAFATTKQKPKDHAPPGGVYINNPAPQGWRNPHPNTRGELSPQ
jgi:hypothetical protein